MEEEKQDKVNEPRAEYSRKITFFNSFEEAELHGLKEMAGHSYTQRMENLELLRKRMFADRLDANGNWLPLEKTITIIKGHQA